MTNNTQKERFTRVGMIRYFMHGITHFFVLSIIASFLVTMLEMLIPQIIRSTVDSIIGDKPFSLPAAAVSWIDRMGGAPFFRTHLWVIAVIIIVLALFVALFRYATNQFNNVAAEKLQQSMRDKLFAHLQELPFRWYMQNKTGDIMQRCTSDVERVRIFIAEQMVSVVRIVIMMILSLFFMFSMDARLGAAAAATIPVIMAYSGFFFSRIGRHFKECDDNEGVLSTIAQENLTGVRVVRAFGREDYERKRFEKQNVYYTGLWVDLMKLMSYFWGAGDLITGIQVVLVLTMGSVFCVHGSLTTGEFIAFLSYNGMLIWPVRQLGRMISEMSKAGVSIDRIRYIMNSPVEEDVPDAKEPDMHQDIHFDHVTFGYEENVPVVKDVSFTVKAGTTFGILGSTGSGKSTLMHLLDRLYDLPEGSGTIRIGDTDIRDIKAKYLRSNIGMVLQEPFLFSRTIGQNIGIIDRDMPMDQIRTAARLASIDEAIGSFKNGYDTMVGERGVTLSGGQKQRTAIARMLTQKAPIMVFDDSLSAVDAETDAKIRSALNRHLKDSTVILIAHRVTTLMNADQIMVMDKGKIVEMGTPDQLMAKGGVYKRIYDMQLTMSEEDEFTGNPFEEVEAENEAAAAGRNEAGCASGNSTATATVPAKEV